jgi:sphingolipid delta-4 desaturase
LQYQGDELFDTDIPTTFEAKMFHNTFGKFCWLALQPFFYAIRPLVVYPKPPSNLEIINTIIQLTFDYLVFHFFGVKSLLYLLSGTILALGLHPVAGHFVSEVLM